MTWRRRSAVAAIVVAALLAGGLPTAGQQPAPSARTWIGHEPQIEAYLRTATVVSLEDIGTGVTRPRRARLSPPTPVESFTWKVLPPERRNGFWESYKSEIAAYELDKLLAMKMVPPVVERSVDGDVGAAVMWVKGLRSVKQRGGKVPEGPVWGKPLRKMQMFDNLIGNPDRNAGNILVGPPGELILIDHSRAFITDTDLRDFTRVDAKLWDRMQQITRDDLKRTLGAWIDDRAIDAMITRRTRMAEKVARLVKKNGRAHVIIP